MNASDTPSDSSLLELPIRHLVGAWTYVIGFGVLILVWIIAARLVGDEVFLPSPLATVGAMLKLARGGGLEQQIAVSATRVFVGFTLGGGLALIVGLLVGLSRGVESATEPLIELFRAIPPYAMIPFALLAFGIGSAGKLFVLAYAAFFPILLNTVGGVQSVQPRLIEAATTLGASRPFVVLRVVFPAAFPQIVLGLRLGFGTAWLALIAAEMVASDNGLGFLISNAQDTINTPVVVGGMLVIGLLGYAANRFFAAGEKWAAQRGTGRT